MRIDKKQVEKMLEKDRPGKETKYEKEKREKLVLDKEIEEERDKLFSWLIIFVVIVGLFFLFRACDSNNNEAKPSYIDTLPTAKAGGEFSFKTRLAYLKQVFHSM